MLNNISPIFNTVGNGSAVAFALPYSVTKNSDINVYKETAVGAGTYTLLTSPSGYSVSGTPTGGPYAENACTITLVSAPATGIKVIIARNSALSQLLVLPSNGAYNPKSLELGLDAVVRVAQDVKATTLGQSSAGLWDANSKKIINLAAGLADTDAANVGQLAPFAATASAAATAASTSATASAGSATSASTSASSATASATASASSASSASASAVSAAASAAIATANANAAITVQSSDFTLTAAMTGKVMVCNTALAATLDPAATLGNGWYCWIKNVSTGIVTITAGGSELIEGLTTIPVTSGASIMLVSNGTGFNTLTQQQYPSGYLANSRPTYESATTLDVGVLYCRDRLDRINITKDTATTANFNVVGLNGVLQSANLAGTITVSNTGTSVTGVGTSFTTSFQVGDVLTTAGGNARRITAIASNTSMTILASTPWTTTETAVTYKRGGRAANTWYSLYATSNGATAGLVLSTRNVAGGDALPDLPAGYSLFRQFSFATRLDNSRSQLPFVVSGSPQRSKVTYPSAYTAEVGSPYAVLDNATGTATTWTTVDLSALVPPISQLAILYAYGSSVTGSSDASVRPAGDPNTGLIIIRTNNGVTYAGPSTVQLSTNSQQQAEYIQSASGSRLYLFVIGWEATRTV
jgi:hypothetical protein